MSKPLVKRRRPLKNHVLSEVDEPSRYSPSLPGVLQDFIHSVKARHLEGLVAKHDSYIEDEEVPGARRPSYSSEVG